MAARNRPLRFSPKWIEALTPATPKGAKSFRWRARSLGRLVTIGPWVLASRGIGGGGTASAPCRRRCTGAPISTRPLLVWRHGFLGRSFERLAAKMKLAGLVPERWERNRWQGHSRSQRMGKLAKKRPCVESRHVDDFGDLRIRVAEALEPRLVGQAIVKNVSSGHYANSPRGIVGRMHRHGHVHEGSKLLWLIRVLRTPAPKLELQYGRRVSVSCPKTPEFRSAALKAHDL